MWPVPSVVILCSTATWDLNTFHAKVGWPGNSQDDIFSNVIHFPVASPSALQQRDEGNYCSPQLLQLKLTFS